MYINPVFYREQVNKLRLEMSQLGVLLKEESAAESKESAESSGENDSHTNLHGAMQTLRSEARSHQKVVRLLKEQLQRNAKAKADGGPGVDPELIDSMARKMERVREEHEATQRHAASLEDRLKEIQIKERNQSREREENDRKKKGRQDQNKKLNKSLKHAVSLHIYFMFLCNKLFIKKKKKDVLSFQRTTLHPGLALQEMLSNAQELVNE